MTLLTCHLNQDGVRFGDNDNLAALTAVQLEAEGVFLFTDVDYLYTANPNVDPAAEPMKAAT
jgi:glutamate 5-kinase